MQTMKKSRFSSIKFFAFPLLLAFAVPLLAGAPVVHAQEEEAESAAPQETAPLDLSSPRATLRTFLEAMNAVQAGNVERWPDVLACISLSEVPEEERDAEGQVIAQQLYGILNALTLDLDSITDEAGVQELEPGPDESEIRDLSIVVGEVGEEQNKEEVSLDFRLNDDGQWRFSRSKLEAQIEELQEVVEEAAEEAEPVPASVNLLIASPRSPMRSFLESFGHWDDGGREQALVTLDLSGVAENIRADRGEELAFRLKDIIDRDRLVIYQEILDPWSGGPYVHLIDPSDSTNRRKIEIVSFAVGGVEGALEWKFSQATLDNLQAMWIEHYHLLEVVSGVVEQPYRPIALRLQDYMTENIPFMMKHAFLLDNWQWIGLLVIILLGMGVSRIAAFFLLLLVRRIFRREHLQIDTKLEIGFVRPIRIAIMAWVWWIAMRPLGLPSDLLSWMKTIVTTLSAAAAVWAVYRLVDILGTYVAALALKSANKYDDMVVPLIVRTLKVFVVAVGFIFVLDMSGGDTTKLLAGLGIGGLAFAFAAKDTIGNLLGSLTLLFDRPFQIGDWIQIGDVDGSVESVGMRSTRVRTFYNSMVTIPNSELTNSTIDNYGARRYRRFKTNVSITYDTPPEKIDAFCEGMRELIRKHPYTRKDYFHVYLNSFGDSSLNILLYCFHECPDWSTELRERHRLMVDIIRLASRLGVEFAFPTQTLYMQATDGASDGSAPAFASQDALAKGRSEADRIVEEFSGKNAPLPPPVTFEIPQGEVAESGDET